MRLKEGAFWDYIVQIVVKLDLTCFYVHDADGLVVREN